MLQDEGRCLFDFILMGVTIGSYVKDLELIAKATDAEEWTSVVQHLPFK